MIVSGVFDLADGTIGLHQRVESMDSVTVAGLVLRLVVSGVGVRYGVREVIFGVSLQLYQRYAQVDSNDWYIYKIELPMISLLCRRLGPFFLLYVRT